MRRAGAILGSTGPGIKPGPSQAGRGPVRDWLVHRLVAVRHGETDWNRVGRWQGWTDRPLLPESVDAARRRARWLAERGVAPSSVWSSDLLRAVQTAEAMAHELGVECTVDADLRERHGGELEGLDRAGIDESFPGFLAAWRNGDVDAPPGGESDDTVFDRVISALSRVDAAASIEHPAVVVTHGGVLRILAERGGAEAAGTPNLGGRWFDISVAGLIAGPLLDPLTEPPPDHAKHQVE
jgi:broad specificity phosphatase PhoE